MTLAPEKRREAVRHATVSPVGGFDESLVIQPNFHHKRENLKRKFEIPLRIPDSVS